jgi:acyl-CoA thioesterase
MAVDCEKVKAFLNEHDRFCRFCGIELTVVKPGYAEAVLTVTPEVLNGRGVVQGGAIMTLADFAYAGAVNSSGAAGVSLNCQTNFIRPGGGDTMKAVARMIHQGRSTAVCSVEVFNGDGKLAATANITGFIIDDKPVYECKQ